ncbi:MAG TPA: hypothetical protein VFE89_13560 [Beijerinckiaceae bacterium]|nr:hypothetical protein [Beijerinckiaceae bacterium]
MACSGLASTELYCLSRRSFSYSVQNGNSRIPTTLVVGVPLMMTKQIIQAMWHNVRGSTVILDSPATLSAVY